MRKVLACAVLLSVVLPLGALDFQEAWGLFTDSEKHTFAFGCFAGVKASTIMMTETHPEASDFLDALLRSLTDVEDLIERITAFYTGPKNRTQPFEAAVGMALLEALDVWLKEE